MGDRKSTVSGIDARRALEQFHDYLAPRLDVFEQAVYLYILRHSRLQGKPRLTVELKSARHKIARGLGKRGGPLAAHTCLEKLKSLDAKGCIKLADERESSTDVRVLLPSEIPGLIEKEGRKDPKPELEEMDFYNDARNRQLIFKREEGRCFYCLKKLNESNASLAHVASRPPRDDGYRNVVVSCRRCNTRKGESSGEDLLRVLYRESAVTAAVLAARLDALGKLRAGKLRPPV